MHSKIFQPGSFVIVGRHEDTDRLMVIEVENAPAKTTMESLCKMVLREMGKNNPLVFQFIALLYAPRSGGFRVILDYELFRKYIYLKYKKLSS